MSVRCERCGMELSADRLDIILAPFLPRVTLWGFLKFLVHGHRPPTASSLLKRNRYSCESCGEVAWEESLPAAD